MICECGHTKMEHRSYVSQEYDDLCWGKGKPGLFYWYFRCRCSKFVKIDNLKYLEMKLKEKENVKC
jgi:hypothetical protein